MNNKKTFGFKSLTEGEPPVDLIMGMGSTLATVPEEIPNPFFEIIKDEYFLLDTISRIKKPKTNEFEIWIIRKNIPAGGWIKFTYESKEERNKVFDELLKTLNGRG